MPLLKYSHALYCFCLLEYWKTYITPLVSNQTLKHHSEGVEPANSKLRDVTFSCRSTLTSPLANTPVLMMVKMKMWECWCIRWATMSPLSSVSALNVSANVDQQVIVMATTSHPAGEATTVSVKSRGQITDIWKTRAQIQIEIAKQMGQMWTAAAGECASAENVCVSKAGLGRYTGNTVKWMTSPAHMRRDSCVEVRLKNISFHVQLNHKYFKTRHSSFKASEFLLRLFFFFNFRPRCVCVRRVCVRGRLDRWQLQLSHLQNQLSICRRLALQWLWRVCVWQVCVYWSPTIWRLLWEMSYLPSHPKILLVFSQLLLKS